ncbi:hypothetical protein [Naasia lichenicola]|uniref:Asp23/Gls24 family envelope stress response protein n=1 Tax=Naasia lichenicola TaxID=2565933 RepID=A0A4S4FL17_9MICO|nr:hypothetical protein [Naasia lichenicola]THG30005.1 hypothetical protein E6C64_15300 [Naasia lichenicola]
MSIDVETMGYELDDLIRSTPGVAALFPAEASPLALATTLVAGALSRPVPASVSVSTSPAADLADGVEVTVKARVAVDASWSAAEVCRAVHDAVVERIAADFPAATSIVSVGVAQVAD